MPLDKFGRSSSSTTLLSSRLRYGGHIGGKIKHTTDGDIDAENLKICNVKEPTADGDASNKHYVDTQINKIKNSFLLHTYIFSKTTDDITGRFMIFDVPHLFEFRVINEGVVVNASCSAVNILLNNKEYSAAKELIGHTLKIGDIFTFTTIVANSYLLFELITRVHNE